MHHIFSLHYDVNIMSGHKQEGTITYVNRYLMFGWLIVATVNNQ